MELNYLPLLSHMMTGTHRAGKIQDQMTNVRCATVFSPTGFFPQDFHDNNFLLKIMRSLKSFKGRTNILRKPFKKGWAGHCWKDDGVLTRSRGGLNKPRMEG